MMGDTRENALWVFSNVQRICPIDIDKQIQNEGVLVNDFFASICVQMFSNLGNIKERLESVTHNVSQGWKTISDKAKSVNQKIVRKTTLLTEEYIEGQDQTFNCDIEAGSEILERYALQWSEIHEKSRSSAQEAENADKVINSVLKRCTDLRNTMTIFHGEMDKLPEMVKNVQTATEDIAAIGSQAEVLEVLLMDLEEVCEKLDVERHKNSHRLKMVMMQQNKLDDLEKLKEDLQLQQTINNQKKEKLERQESIERQKVYEDAFLEQMNYYIQFGKTDEHVSNLPESEGSLADIKLEDYDLDKQLNDFLGTEESEDPSIPNKNPDKSKHKRKSTKTKSKPKQHESKDDVKAEEKMTKRSDKPVDEVTEESQTREEPPENKTEIKKTDKDEKKIAVDNQDK